MKTIVDLIKIKLFWMIVTSVLALAGTFGLLAKCTFEQGEESYLQYHQQLTENLTSLPELGIEDILKDTETGLKLLSPLLKVVGIPIKQLANSNVETAVVTSSPAVIVTKSVNVVAPVAKIVSVTPLSTSQPTPMVQLTVEPLAPTPTPTPTPTLTPGVSVDRLKLISTPTFVPKVNPTPTPTPTPTLTPTKR